MDVLDLLSSDQYINVNKGVIRKFGLHEAILLGSLCSRQRYWREHWDETKYGKFDGFFFCTAEELENETTLSPYLQRSALKNLENKCIIHTCLRGVPAKKYFMVDSVALKMAICEEKSVQSNSETDFNPSQETASQLGVNQIPTNNNKDNNLKDNNNKNISSGEEKKKSKKKEYSAEILDVITYMNNRLGTRYRATSAGTVKYISARLNEGFTVEDFKVIIDKKYDDWHGTEYEKYLRPATLFAPSHFEDYLNQSVKKRQVPSYHINNEENVTEKREIKWTGDEY